MEKLTHLGEKTLKTNPGPPGWGLDKGLQLNSGKTNFAMKVQSSIAGWIFGKQTRHCKRMKTMEFNIATWNVRSMLQAGKMEEIAYELKKYNIQITALQEVRWPHIGWIKKKIIRYYIVD